MNTIDTIYLTGDLITEKLCGCKEALPVIIQQTKEPCCDNVKAIVPTICLTIAVVTLLIVAGEVVWHLVKLYKEKEEKEKERKYKERENLIKLKQDYQARVLEEFTSYKKIWNRIEEKERKLKEKKKDQEKKGEVQGAIDVVEEISSFQDTISKWPEERVNCFYSGELKSYIEELDSKIKDINDQLEIITIVKNRTGLKEQQGKENNVGGTPTGSGTSKQKNAVENINKSPMESTHEQ